MAANEPSQRNMQADILINEVIEKDMSCRSLDIAYQKIRQKTSDCACKMLVMRNEKHYNVGSVSEAMPLTVCGDHDSMSINGKYPYVLWTFEPPKRNHAGGYVVAEHNKEEPAYLRLKVNENEPLHECLKCTISKNNGYMKPDVFKDVVTPKNNEDLEGIYEDILNKGPALQSGYITGNDPMQIEFAAGLKCQTWPFVTDGFYSRERFNNWPSNELLKKIYKLGCHVVPVGHHSSPLKEMEWRISFSLAERELCFELFEPYAKCMFGLKLIKRGFIDGHCKSEQRPTPFCSYFIKTACFWMCETVPHKDLATMDLARQTLGWLIDCYERKELPHYFIPEQNLIGHLTSEQCESIKSLMLHVRTKLCLLTSTNVERFPNTMTNKLRPIESTLLMKFKSTTCYFGNLIYFVPETYYNECECSWEKFITRLEKFTEAINKNIKKTVPGYEELFKHHLYFAIGDTCTSLFIDSRNQGLLNNAAPNPLDYYKRGGAIVHDDGWQDDMCIGTFAHTIRYHYLMGNYEELKHEFSKYEPLVTEVKQNAEIVNGLRKIFINARIEFDFNAWIIDNNILQRIKHLTPVSLFNPIVFIFYVMAILSLKDGDLDKASNTLNDMKKCYDVIRYKEWDCSQILIDIIDIEIIKVTRMLEMPAPDGKTPGKSVLCFET